LLKRWKGIVYFNVMPNLRLIFTSHPKNLFLGLIRGVKSFRPRFRRVFGVDFGSILYAFLF